MENWFLIAIIAPILWSIVNHIDKNILSRYQEGKGVNSILIFSTLSSVIILPFIVFFKHSEIFNISLSDFLILIFIGFLSASAFYFYLKGMDVEEASVVVPLFQLIPIFGYILSYFILGEVLTLTQLLFSLIIICGIIMISLEIDIDNKISLKKRVLVLITVSSFLFALHDTLFKKIAVVDSFWISVFWQYLGLTLFGLILLTFFKRSRGDFLLMINNSKKSIITLNATSELLYVGGNLANNFATLLAPVAIVLVVSSYQPLFVFIGGIFLTLFFPKITMEKISTKHFFHKLISILIIIIGSVFLYTSSTH
jgi:drug/metabolite transporter (DMT)-like permease